jgi:hypothetical protein
MQITSMFNHGGTVAHMHTIIDVLSLRRLRAQQSEYFYIAALSSKTAKLR